MTLRRWICLGLAAALVAAIVTVVRLSGGSTLQVTPQQVIFSGSDGQLAMVVPLESGNTLKPIELTEKKNMVVISVQVHRPFTPPWDRTNYTLTAETKRVMVELDEPLAGKELVDIEGKTIPVDRLPAGCGIPDPEASDSPLAIGTRNLKRSQSSIKVAFGDPLKRKIDQIETTECADRVYVSAVPGSKRSSRRVQIVTVQLDAPIGERQVMSMSNNPLPAY